MDTTETYIKICGKAEEIQENHKIEDGDFYFRKLNSEKKGNWYISYTSSESDYSVDHPDQWDYIHGKIIWLPRQDQLQEMIGGDRIKTLKKLVDSVSRPEAFDLPMPSNLDDDASLEQLWLAFVMKDNGKVWNGEDWVTEEVKVG